MNLQKCAKMVGESGCYFLSILRAGGCELEFPHWYMVARLNGWMEENCLMTDSAALMGAVMSGNTPYKFTCTKQPADYVTKPSEIEILRYEIVKSTLGKDEVLTHFVLGDGKGGIAFDPWENSLTVMNGKLAGKRIFTKV